MKEILNSLEALFLQFNFRRLLFWLFLIIIVIIGVFSWESLTGYFFFAGMEKKISLLKDLHSLGQEGITQSKELNPIYQDIVLELAAYKTYSIQQLSGLEGFWKFISGASLGIAIAVAGIADRAKPSKNWKSTVTGGIAFGILTGALGTVLPIIYSPWINYLIYPILQVLIILGISRLVRKRKQIESHQSLQISSPIKS